MPDCTKCRDEFQDWVRVCPDCQAALEADLVAHCGDSAEGFYLTTLSTVDVATGWCEPVAVWGERTGARWWRRPPCARTPSQCLLRSDVLTEDKKRELANIYGAPNPVTLLKQIRQSVEHLWTLAEDSPSTTRTLQGTTSVTGIITPTRRASVTALFDAIRACHLLNCTNL